jgi:hypothetical protein
MDDINVMHDKWLIFAGHYLETLNIADAAKKTGIGYNTGLKWYQKEIVRQYIIENLNRKVNLDKRICKADEILWYLSSVMMGIEYDEMYTILKSGSRSEYEEELKKSIRKVNTRDRLAAAKLLLEYFPQDDCNNKLVCIVDDIPAITEGDEDYE